MVTSMMQSQEYGFPAAIATTRLGRFYFSEARGLMHCYQRTFGSLSDDEFDQMCDSEVNKLYRLLSATVKRLLRPNNRFDIGKTVKR